MVPDRNVPDYGPDAVKARIWLHWHCQIFAGTRICTTLFNVGLFVSFLVVNKSSSVCLQKVKCNVCKQILCEFIELTVATPLSQYKLTTKNLFYDTRQVKYFYFMFATIFLFNWKFLIFRPQTIWPAFYFWHVLEVIFIRATSGTPSGTLSGTRATFSSGTLLEVTQHQSAVLLGERCCQSVFDLF